MIPSPTTYRWMGPSNRLSVLDKYDFLAKSEQVLMELSLNLYQKMRKKKKNEFGLGDKNRIFISFLQCVTGKLVFTIMIWRRISFSLFLFFG